MSSTRAKAESGRDGLNIKLRRTNLDYTNKIFTDDAENPETLDYGEPLYFSSDDTLAIGDNNQTPIDQLKVAKLVPRGKENRFLFLNRNNDTTFDNTAQIYDNNELVYFSKDDLAIVSNGSTISKNLKVIKFLNKAKSLVMSFFDSRDPSGITRFKDEADNTIYAKELNWPNIVINPSSMTYYQINTSNVLNPTAIQSTATNPGCYKIAVTNMKDSYTPSASLIIPNSNLNDYNTIKTMKKAYARITSMQTYNGGVIVFCSRKPDTTISIQLIGG